MLWEHLLLPENSLVHLKAEAAPTHLLQPSLLAGYFQFPQSGSQSRRAVTLRQEAARQRLVPRTNFSF